jgi:hypothetical protein
VEASVDVEGTDEAATKVALVAMSARRDDLDASWSSAGEADIASMGGRRVGAILGLQSGHSEPELGSESLAVAAFAKIGVSFP